MADFINTVDVIGDDALTDSIIVRSVTECKDNNVTTIGKSAFRGCSQLKKVDFPAATTIETYAFYGCSILDTVILRNESTVCMINEIFAFGETPIYSKNNGYIYVPAALVDSYKTATNWSTYKTQIRAIEDYPEICGY